MYSENKGSNPAYIKNDNFPYISPLQVPKGRVYMKLSLILSQNLRNNSIFKKVYDFWDTLFIPFGSDSAQNVERDGSLQRDKDAANIPKMTESKVKKSFPIDWIT